MKKFLKLLKYVILSITVVYFIFNNVYALSDMSLTSDFAKNGTQTDVVKFSKKIEEEMRATINVEKNDENIDTEEKEYKSVDELALDYPMGTTFYSMTMARGQLQIETLCVSIIYGIIVGMNIFIFNTDEEIKLKKLGIYFIINLVVGILVMEIVQILTLVFAYGTIYFVPISIQYVMAIIAIFLFAFAMNKGGKDMQERNKIREQELKEKIAQKLRKNK